MALHDDAERLRLGYDGAEDDARRADPEGPAGEAARVGITTTDGTYPTAAQAVYKLSAADCFGAETEGAAGSVTDSGATFYALNLGGTVPPQGSQVICNHIGMRWVFRYG